MQRYYRFDWQKINEMRCQWSVLIIDYISSVKVLNGKSVRHKNTIYFFFEYSFKIIPCVILKIDYFSAMHRTSSLIIYIIQRAII